MHLMTDDVVLQDASGLSTSLSSGLSAVSKTPAELADLVSRFALSDGWLERVRLRTEHRWYERLYHGPDYDIWAISWMPGQSTGFHDHGESSGAFSVVTGVLEEHCPGKQALAIYPGEIRAFTSDYAHDVRNVSLAPAVSIHAYSPPLSEMNEYELAGDQLVRRAKGFEEADELEREWRFQKPGTADQTKAVSVDEMLAAARGRLERLSPVEAWEAVSMAGATLIDIRPEGQRATEGIIPGALIIERNVLEWRLDPTSSARLPIATHHDIQAIVFCSEGYTSSLAAAALQDLGLWRATDIVGGFQAWRTEGLPNSSAGKTST